MAGTYNPPANPPAQPAPVAGDDYGQYREWADLALLKAQRDSDDQWIADTRNQWQQMRPRRQAEFGSASKSFWEANEAFYAAKARLDVTVDQALARTQSRMSRKATTQLYRDLHEQLEALDSPVKTAYGALEKLVDIHQYEVLEADMWAILADYVDLFTSERDATVYWIQKARDLQATRSVDDVGVNAAQELATIIKDGYPPPGSEDDGDVDDDGDNGDNGDNGKDDDGGNSVDGGTNGGDESDGDDGDDAGDSDDNGGEDGDDGDDESDSDDNGGEDGDDGGDDDDDDDGEGSESSERESVPKAVSKGEPVLSSQKRKAGNFENPPSKRTNHILQNAGDPPPAAAIRSRASSRAQEDSAQGGASASSGVHEPTPPSDIPAQPPGQPSQGRPIGNDERHVQFIPMTDYDTSARAEVQTSQGRQPPDKALDWPPLWDDPGRNLRWLYNNQKNFTPSFRSWCKKHLDEMANRNHDSLAPEESFARAAYDVVRTQPRDHDYDNDTLLRGPPYRVSSVRRLRSVIANEPQETKDYFNRQIEYAPDGTDVQALARRLQAMFQELGPRNYGEDEDVIVTNIPVSVTAKLPMHGSSIVGQWMFMGVVGQGGNGRALLYVKLNSAGTIIQRLIAKESFFGPGHWNFRTYWNGPPRDRNLLESHLHRLMNSGHSSVVAFLGDHVDRKLKMMRIYTAYGELGDLHRLWNNHETMRWHTTDENNQAFNARVTQIPAVVVICLCEAMAASVCLMANGQLPSDQGVWSAPGAGQGTRPSPPWPHNIVHRDIKPANYFLTKSNHPMKWAGLPLAALGDFGNGFDAQDLQWRTNPDECRGAGTFNCEAPEQAIQTAGAILISSYTNVYQVGLVMFQLMTLKAPTHQVTFHQREHPFPPVDPEAYPPELVQLATECLHPVPAARPSAKDLYMRMRSLATAVPMPPIEGYNGLPWENETVPAAQFVWAGPRIAPM